MIPPVQTLRLNKKEVDVLNSLKRRLKINQWNVLCRMAFCLSCQDESEPSTFLENSSQGGVELDWETFAGNSPEVYTALVAFHKLRSKSELNSAEYFKRLISRGIHRLRVESI